ncbi:hypothetical protein HPB47_001855 [Ixodes persulcatus]|uniref:Uncharacterized protein n=1 Tax=Ixodes persulcatus TaxID=34615 RepID=A0AC60PP43_IXOPE|nr:hypothetical protein HPB47_001855 [Ixodes persulcatus]
MNRASISCRARSASRSQTSVRRAVGLLVPGRRDPAARKPRWADAEIARGPRGESARQKMGPTAWVCESTPVQAEYRPPHQQSDAAPHSAVSKRAGSRSHGLRPGTRSLNAPSLHSGVGEAPRHPATRRQWRKIGHGT